MNKLLICTDLDRTLLPNGPQPESENARTLFAQLVARDDVALTYVTGRDKSLVLQAIKKYKLPQPDFVLADVGSTIYKVEKGEWNSVEAWDNEISQDWNGKTNKDIQGLLKSYHKIRKQEYGRQKPHKLSYYVPLHIDQVLLLKEIDICLKNAQVNANLIWSIDEQAGLGLLDILPESANKNHAIEFLIEKYGFEQSETIFIGDSGNDISVMASSIQSVLVANATDEIKKATLEQASMNNESDSIYIAKGNFYGMNGNYCAGILEGIVHYKPAVKDWLGLHDA